MKKLLCLVLVILNYNLHAETVTSMIEFFSYQCSHCSNVNSLLSQYVSKNSINFIAINVDQSEQALPTNIMYLVAVDAGLGFQFQQEYFNAIRNGMIAYSDNTLRYVTNKIMTPKFAELLKDRNERNSIKTKLKQAHALLVKYPIQVTPTFLINGTTLLEGEDIVKTLYWSKNK
jgi:protein-disulfide isomerase